MLLLTATISFLATWPFWQSAPHLDYGIMERLFQFQQGERDFEDILTIEDFIEPVTTRDDGTFVDLDGNSYGPWEIMLSADSRGEAA